MRSLAVNLVIPETIAEENSVREALSSLQKASKHQSTMEYKDAVNPIDKQNTHIMTKITTHNTGKFEELHFKSYSGEMLSI